MAELELLKGFKVVDLEESKGDSTLTLTSTNIKFNKATAIELGFPAYVKMSINAVTKQVAIQTCNEGAKNIIPFSKDEIKQKYAIVLKIPALMAAIRKLVDADDNTASMVFDGTLYANEKVIIYDLANGKTLKPRGRKKNTETEEQGKIKE